MRRCFGPITVGTAVLAFHAALVCAATSPHYLVTNDDGLSANTATFYAIAADGSLSQKKIVKTGGTGIGGGLLADARVNLLHDKAQSCVYVSDGGSNDVAAIDVATLKRTGTFKAGDKDSGGFGGIGLASNQHYLYAGFDYSGTIATYKILKGCKLKFLEDVPSYGLNGGGPDGMAVHGSILVMTYEDGSVESFNIAKGVPVTNGDKMYSTASGQGDNRPAGVDITRDGKFAIFGDISGGTVIEVSDISSGKLTPTIVYTPGTGINSNNLELSPDESLLYISNSQGGTVTAANFDSTTGAVSEGCVSKTLRGFDQSWSLLGALALENNGVGTGSAIYVAEWGQNTGSGIGELRINANGSKCTLTERKASPFEDKHSPGLLSISSYPPRSF